jgi:hypothetical protein
MSIDEAHKAKGGDVLINHPGALSFREIRVVKMLASYQLYFRRKDGITASVIPLFGVYEID